MMIIDNNNNDNYNNDIIIIPWLQMLQNLQANLQLRYSNACVYRVGGQLIPPDNLQH